MISDKTIRLSMVNNQRVSYNNTNYILKGPLLWVTSWSRSLFITAKFIFGDLLIVVSVVILSARPDSILIISSVITAHKNRKLNNSDPHQRQPLLINYVR